MTLDEAQRMMLDSFANRIGWTVPWEWPIPEGETAESLTAEMDISTQRLLALTAEIEAREKDLKVLYEERSELNGGVFHIGKIRLTEDRIAQLA